MKRMSGRDINDGLLNMRLGLGPSHNFVERKVCIQFGAEEREILLQGNFDGRFTYSGFIQLWKLH